MLSSPAAVRGVYLQIVSSLRSDSIYFFLKKATFWTQKILFFGVFLIKC